VTVGIPKLVEARVDSTGKWGGWKPAWDSYSTNGMVRETFADLVQKRDAKHAETFKIARRAMLSCARYRDGMSRGDFGEELAFIPNADVSVGTSIALFSSDAWIIPLQTDWLESVGKAKPVIDGRFVVGMSEHPGFVYAIDGCPEEGFSICEFAVINGKLGKVAS
jgi:hypothetical protein